MTGVGPEELESTVERLRPAVVLCSSADWKPRDERLCWICFYANLRSEVIVHLEGRKQTLPDLDFDGILAVIDAAQHPGEAVVPQWING
jgi:hypothetical protein